MEWPPQERFPTNRPQHTVYAAIKDELLYGNNILIISGYASLNKIIELVSSIQTDRQTLRIFVGNEPFKHNRQHARQTLPEEVRDYWLARGMSVEQCPKIAEAVRRLRQGQVQTRMPLPSCRSVHAKLYCADKIAMVGSSNLTFAGFHQQIEGNALFTTKEPNRLKETWQLAECIWEQGECCNDYLADLLEDLMKVVTWQEALARACLELLEGDWVDQLLTEQGESKSLWPSQRDGIAQALWVLERMGSVLIADATGSGKTLMGAFLLQAVVAKGIAHGRPNHMCGVICPPNVTDNWEIETLRPGPYVRVVSSGILGRGNALTTEHIEGVLKRADILILDEVHNYHNLKSNRSQSLLDNVAQHLLMFTATPINRSPRDLIALVNLLGADNLSDYSVQMLERHLASHKKLDQLDGAVIDTLITEIRQFTVRRTISALRQYIERDPDAYRNILDQRCDYPNILNHLYPLQESKVDRHIANKIAACAQQLVGIANLLTAIKDDTDTNGDPAALAAYVELRLKAAAALASYRVMDALRSSKYVLLEELIGHNAACEKAGLPPEEKKEHDGVIAKLSSARTVMPEPVIDTALLPPFLTDKAAFNDALKREIGLYQEIAELAQQLTDGRELEKVQQIVSVCKDHAKVLVFERRILALRVIEDRLNRHPLKHRLILATGSQKKAKESIKQTFGLPGAPDPHVGLCSDSMAEGVNLQSASALVMLDMPSVIRIAEQRVGRIERLDSPHDQIEVFWPRDAAEFRLKKDAKFLDRVHTVERLLGGNLKLPEELVQGSEIDTPEQEIAHYQDQRNLSDQVLRIEDAFYPVRSLIGGDDGLISETIMDALRQTTGMVVSRVSVLPSLESSWAFLSIGGDKERAPLWALITENDGCEIELNAIAIHLRKHLNEQTASLKISGSVTEAMQRLLKQLVEIHRLRLGRKRLAILELLEDYLVYEQKQAGKEQQQERIDFYSTILSQLPNAADDLHLERPEGSNLITLEQLADAFRDLVQPLRVEKLRKEGTKKLVRYRDLLPTLKRRRLAFEDLRAALEPTLRFERDESRIVSAIFGIKTEGPDHVL